MIELRDPGAASPRSEHDLCGVPWWLGHDLRHSPQGSRWSSARCSQTRHEMGERFGGPAAGVVIESSRPSAGGVRSFGREDAGAMRTAIDEVLGEHHRSRRDCV
jgi:hypothetical protein